MADRITKKERSKNMSQIKGHDNKLEKRIRSLLFSKGYRYRVKSNLLGRPDVIFSSRRFLIFINGCFWHQHGNCTFAYFPKTNKKFWSDKFEGNIQRDKLVKRRLINQGWNVYTMWECEIDRNFTGEMNKLVVKLK